LFKLRQVFVCLFHGISHLSSPTIDNIWAVLSAIHGPAAYLLNGLQRSSNAAVYKADVNKDGGR